MLFEGSGSSLTAAARQLGVEPFEVIRLLVASGRMGATLEVQADDVKVLRKFGRIERWWDEGLRPLDDADVRSGLVRASLKELLDRGHVEPSRARLDNLWRGLPVDQQSLLQSAMDALDEAQLLRIEQIELGTVVTIPADRADTIRAFIAGEQSLPQLAEILGG